jgi:thiol:disulfide interchange protein DsbC
MRLIRAFTTTFLLLASTCAMAQDANLKKILSERLPSLPKIEEISKTPMAGVFEIRVQGNEIFYTDAKGDFLIQGALIDTKQKRNLTEERNDKLSAIPFDSLPIKICFHSGKGQWQTQIGRFFRSQLRLLQAL